MQHKINLTVYGKDTTTYADICDIYLDNHQWKKAQEFAYKGLKVCNPLHAESIKFYCILIQAYYMSD